MSTDDVMDQCPRCTAALVLQVNAERSGGSSQFGPAGYSLDTLQTDHEDAHMVCSHPACQFKESFANWQARVTAGGPMVLIELSGGCVQAVSSTNSAVRAEIIDWDNPVDPGNPLLVKDDEAPGWKVNRLLFPHQIV